jgi:hypothetical protein
MVMNAVTMIRMMNTMNRIDQIVYTCTRRVALTFALHLQALGMHIENLQGAGFTAVYSMLSALTGKLQHQESLALWPHTLLKT